MKLIYISYGNVSVFDSQVVALLNQYIQANLVEEIILILGISYKETSIKKDKIKGLNNKIQVFSYKQYPQYPLIENRTIRSVTHVLKEIGNLNKYILHIRNEVLAFYVYKALKKINVNTNKMIADVRGAGLEQLIEFSNKNSLVLGVKKYQRNQVNKILGKIQHLSVVSVSLKHYINNKVNEEIEVRVNSCLSNKNFTFDEMEREKLRKELKIQDNEILLVLSTGGDNAWQNTRETIESLTRKNFKILNLSRTEIENKNVITKFVPYDEMYKYLSAADAAIIFRDKSITNKVASPVKFSEYVCCGLPVITNKSVDLITDYIESNNCGSIIGTIGSINYDLLLKMYKLDRQKISKKGIEKFGIETIANQYVNFYKSI